MSSAGPPSWLADDRGRGRGGADGDHKIGVQTADVLHGVARTGPVTIPLHAFPPPVLFAAQRPHVLIAATPVAAHL